MTARRASQAKLSCNVVRLSEWRAVPADARRKPSGAPLLAGIALSAAAHALALLFLQAPGMAPPPTAPEPLDVVLVQPPVTLPPSAQAERSAPTPEPRRAVPRATQRAAKTSPPARRRDEAPAPAPADAQPAPVMTAPREDTQPALLPAPAAAAAPPAETRTSPPPAVAGRVEPVPSGAGSAGAPTPGPLSPPSFNAAYLRNPAPRYPLMARRNGEQGTVTLRVRVTRSGEPGSVVLERSSGSAALDAAALATVKEWRFVPARRNGEAVEASVLVPIVFRLRDAS